VPSPSRDVELAIWFHDAFMATRHEAAPRSADEKALVDVDLWIMGAPRERFDE